MIPEGKPEGCMYSHNVIIKELEGQIASLKTELGLAQNSFNVAQGKIEIVERILIRFKNGKV